MVEAPPAGLHAEPTAILSSPGSSSLGPELGALLHDGETVLLTEADRKWAPPGASPPEEPHSTARQGPAEAARQGRWPLYLLAVGLSILAGALLYHLLR